jgi:hypothetical protein
MEAVGILIAILLLGGGAAFVAHEVGKAREAGILAAAPKTGSRGARAKVTARNAPHNVRTIFAQAYADNWVAKRGHVRERKAAAPPKPPRRSLMQRLVAPGQPTAFAGASPAPAAAPAAASTNGHRPGAAIPATPAPAARPRIASVPSPTTGRPAMSSAPPSAAPTGAAADMFSAANILNGHAKAGGIHGKLRGERVYGEALGFIANALEQFAKDMQETGRYPAMTWEPVMTAAAHVRAGGMSMTEAANALTRLGNMTLLENAGSAVQAPHHDELNRA